MRFVPVGLRSGDCPVRRRRGPPGGVRRRAQPPDSVRALGVGMGAAALALARPGAPGGARHISPRRRDRRLRRARAALRGPDPWPRRRCVRGAAGCRARAVRPRGQRRGDRGLPIPARVAGRPAGALRRAAGPGQGHRGAPGRVAAGGLRGDARGDRGGPARAGPAGAGADAVRRRPAPRGALDRLRRDRA